MNLAEDFMKQFADNAKKEEKIYKFTDDLTHLINKYSIDSMAGIADFKIADILIKRLKELI